MIRSGLFGNISSKVVGESSSVRLEGAGNDSWIRFEIPEVRLVPGALYVFELKHLSGDPWGVNYSSNSYSSGRAIVRGFPVNSDLLFREGYGNPPLNFPVTVGSVGGGIALIADIASPNGLYPSNTFARLTALPDPGWSFLRWSGDTTSNNSVTELLVNRPVWAQAIFGTKVFRNVTGLGMIVLEPDLPVSLPAYYPYGSSVMARALPEDGYSFAGWSGSIEGTSSSVEFVVTNSQPVITATFVPANALVSVTTIAGSGAAGYLDGPRALEGKLNGPDGPSFSSDGTLYFTDVANHCIRFISTGGALGTLAGGGRVGYADAVGTNAVFSFPLGARILRNGTIAVADTENDVLRRISTPSGEVKTLSGIGARGYANGPANAAQFAFPNDLVEGPDGTLYVTEFQNHVIRRVSADGRADTLAGSGEPGYANGLGAQTQFNQPAGIAIAPDGNLYVTEWNSHRIRKVTPAGEASTVAGTGFAGYRDGSSASAEFKNPNGIVMTGEGDFFIADQNNHVIRRIRPDGQVSTVAGLGRPGFADGDESSALFNAPSGIAMAPDGSLVVTESANHRIRRIRFPRKPLTVSISLSESITEGRWAFHLKTKGAPNAKVLIQVSHDLLSWCKAREATLSASGDLEVTGLAEEKAAFYRVVNP